MMTPPSEPNPPLDLVAGATVDSWFAGQHRDMGVDLAGTLDLSAGLQEILLAGQHRDMGVDLAGTLNLDSGLAAILPHHKRQPPPPTRFDSFTDLLDWFSAVPTVRLIHRTQLRILATYTEILHSVSARGHAHDPALARRFVRDVDLARALILDLARALDLARDLDRELIRALDLDSVRVLVHTVIRTLAIDDTRDFVLNSALAHARDLAVALDSSLDRARDFDHARVRGLRLTRTRDQAYDLVRTLCGMLVNREVKALVYVISGQRPVFMRLDLASIGPRETRRLNELAADFTGVDLREAALSGLDLVGVRWSKTTRWPVTDVDWIVAASEPVGNDVYVIQGSSATGGVTVVPDPVSV